MKNLNHEKTFKPSIFVVLILFSIVVYGQPQFNNGNDPKPADKRWVKIENLSDEFNDGNLNSAKWNSNPAVNSSGNTNGTFIGNAPGVFEQENVVENNNHLTILAERFNSPKNVRGASRIYGGGKVDSKNKINVGYYMEARMKANETIMSSAFWLLPDKTCGQLGNERRQEIDIQECIGRTNSETPFWARFWDRNFHSNAIALEGCGKERDQKQGVKKLEAENHKQFHVYGCWWKSATEFQFFLNGVYEYSITTTVPFTQDMYYRLSSNLYNWQGTTNDEADGFNLPVDRRLTRFDWVRTWQLNDNNNQTPTTQDEISFVSTPTSLNQAQTLSFNLSYTATADRTIGIGIFKAGSWLKSGSVNVAAGSGTQTVNVNFGSLPALGNNYSIQAWIRPRGGSIANDTDREVADNVSIVNNVSVVNNGGGAATEDEISFASTPTSLNQAQSYSFDLSYTATAARTIGIGIFKGGSWLKSGSVNVAAGSGTQTVNVNFGSLPALGNDYSIQAWIRPQGGSIANDTDRKFANNVSIVNGANRLGTGEDVKIQATPNPLGKSNQLLLNVDMPEGNKDVEIVVFDSQGKQVYLVKYDDLSNKGTTYILDVNTAFGDQKGVYIVNVSSGNYNKAIKVMR